MELEVPGKIYNLSPDSGISIRDIVKKICSKLGKDFNEVTEIIEERAGQDSEYILNSDKARIELNWKPKIEIDEGIKQCIDWVNKNWEVIKTQPLEYIHKK
jgi:dTDP-glucose 4,6-dehydratase